MTSEQHVAERVKVLDGIVIGKDGQMGLAHKVAVMWRAHIWLLCAASAALGFFARPWVEQILK